jgi:hypothetical protein
MDLLKDGVPQSQLMKRMFHKHILSWQTWNTWRCQREWKSFRFSTHSREYIWIVLANHIKEEHWIGDMLVAKEGSDIVCFFF